MEDFCLCFAFLFISDLKECIKDLVHFVVQHLELLGNIIIPSTRSASVRRLFKRTSIVSIKAIWASIISSVSATLLETIAAEHWLASVRFERHLTAVSAFCASCHVHLLACASVLPSP